MTETRFVEMCLWAAFAAVAALASLAAAPLALAESKRAVNAWALAGFDAALDRESAGQERLLRTADFAEGVAAFAGRRAPHFTGA